MPTNSTQRPISAPDKEKVKVISETVCEYFSTTIDDLRKPGAFIKPSYIRKFCFYLISINTSLMPEQIGNLFNRNRTQVLRGKELISFYITNKMYAQSLHELTDIVDMCNKFEPKQYKWLIHLTN